MRFRDRASSSRLALEATAYAETEGKAGAFHRAMFQAYWKDALNIGDEAVVRQVGDAAGLGAGGLAEALERRTLRESVQRQLDEARTMRISAVPTFIFDGRFAVQGCQPYEVFERVMEEYVLPAARGEKPPAG